MKRKSIYEEYLRIQLEALMVSVVFITATIGCVAASYKKYRENIHISYLHNQGVTLQIILDNGKAISQNPTGVKDERID